MTQGLPPVVPALDGTLLLGMALERSRRRFVSQQNAGDNVPFTALAQRRPISISAGDATAGELPSPIRNAGFETPTASPSVHFDIPSGAASPAQRLQMPAATPIQARKIPETGSNPVSEQSVVPRPMPAKPVISHPRESPIQVASGEARGDALSSIFVFHHVRPTPFLPLLNITLPRAPEEMEPHVGRESEPGLPISMPPLKQSLSLSNTPSPLPLAGIRSLSSRVDSPMMVRTESPHTRDSSQPFNEQRMGVEQSPLPSLKGGASGLLRELKIVERIVERIVRESQTARAGQPGQPGRAGQTGLPGEMAQVIDPTSDEVVRTLMKKLQILAQEQRFRAGWLGK